MREVILAKLCDAMMLMTQCTDQPQIWQAQ